MNRIVKSPNSIVTVVNYIVKVINYIVKVVNYIVKVINYIVTVVNYIVTGVNYIVKVINYRSPHKSRICPLPASSSRYYKPSDGRFWESQHRCCSASSMSLRRPARNSRALPGTARC